VTVRLTKFAHSCVRLDDDDRSLVVDPGIFLDASEIADVYRGADAVLITHEHPDHINVEALRAAVTADPQLRIWAPSNVADQFGDLGDRVRAVREGESFEAAGFAVQTFGGQHAIIHPTIPVIANVGYLIEGRVYHPGDSLIVPTMPVETLLVPIHAPWSKVAEVVDFVVSVRASAAYPIHDALLTDAGLQFTEGHVTRIGGSHGTEYQHLARREAAEV
jgi:L-ascorbate metabolism protein UlaG (beta-lactamase superfamily)